jgi:hypothetical protein
MGQRGTQVPVPDDFTLQIPHGISRRRLIECLRVLVACFRLSCTNTFTSTWVGGKTERQTRLRSPHTA